MIGQHTFRYLSLSLSHYLNSKFVFHTETITKRLYFASPPTNSFVYTKKAKLKMSDRQHLTISKNSLIFQQNKKKTRQPSQWQYSLAILLLLLWKVVNVSLRWGLCHQITGKRSRGGKRSFPVQMDNLQTSSIALFLVVTNGRSLTEGQSDRTTKPHLCNCFH